MSPLVLDRAALKTAARAAIVITGVFAFADKAIGNPTTALFGSTSAFDNQMDFDNQYASAFSNSGVTNSFSTDDTNVLDAIGWNLAGSSTPSAPTGVSVTSVTVNSPCGVGRGAPPSGGQVLGPDLAISLVL